MPTLLTFVFTLSSILVNSQRITLQAPQSLSPCKIGMRSKMDKFMITGTVGPNYDSLLSAHWNTNVTVQTHTKVFSDFKDICDIQIGQSGSNCTLDSLDKCYCKNFDVVSGNATIVVNVTAEMNYSEAIVRVKWINLDGNYIYSDNVVTVPKIYDPAHVTLGLKVNNQTVKTQSSCRGKFKAESRYTFEVCCYSSVSPCSVQIRFSNFTVENSSSCATYTFMECSNGLKHLKIWFSMCTVKDYKQYSSCLIELACSSQNEFGKSTPENEPARRKSSYALMTGVLWCMLVLLCLCTCQCIISKLSKGVWCHYLNCYEPAVTRQVDNDSSIASASRKANTEASAITTWDDMTTAVSGKTDNKSNISSTRGGDIESNVDMSVISLKDEE